jgi:prevent-host-death family protein
MSLTRFYMLVSTLAKRRRWGVIETANAKTNLSRRVDRAAAGEEIVIVKAGKPKAQLVSYQPRKIVALGSHWT